VITALVHAALCLAPALALWAALALGRYPGEGPVARLLARRRRRGAPASALPLRPLTAVVRLLPDPIACSLAGRAPPRRTAFAQSVNQT
jgi:hypothetical protein